MDVLNAAEIRKVEEVENEIGIPFLKLMSLAGKACTREIMNRYPKDCGKVAVVCGKGKNAGDGFVIARKLHENDYDVSIILAFGEPKAEDAVINYDLAIESGVPVFKYYPDTHFAEQVIGSAAVIVDALFGIGFHGAANEEQADVFEYMSRAAGKVVAIDVPSGVNTDTGAVEGAAVKADLTLAISCYKPAHVLFPAKAYCGETKILDIGISREAFDSTPVELKALDKTEVKALLPKRSRTSHKNDFGHVLAVAGSQRMPGAACLACGAALRTGAGLVTAAFPEKAYPAFGGLLAPEAMRLPLKDNEDGFLTLAAMPVLSGFLKKASVIILGPGLGQCPDVEKVVAAVLEQATCPVVLDADGINAVAKNMSLLETCKAPVIMTPHLGEFSRLTGISVSAIAENRGAVMKKFVKTYGVTLLLKGPDTLVASTDSAELYVNTTGNEGLAKGGSGDTLTGIIAGLLAQGMKPQQAAAVGAYLHGEAAEAVTDFYGKRSLVASDLIGMLPELLKDYE